MDEAFQISFASSARSRGKCPKLRKMTIFKKSLRAIWEDLNFGSDFGSNKQANICVMLI